MPDPTREGMIAAVRGAIYDLQEQMDEDGAGYAAARKHLDALDAVLREIEAGGWRPIDWNAPPKGEVLLYFPEADRGGKNPLRPMWRVGYVDATPRRPTHWQPLCPPLPPSVKEVRP